MIKDTSRFYPVYVIIKEIFFDSPAWRDIVSESIDVLVWYASGLWFDSLC